MNKKIKRNLIFFWFALASNSNAIAFDNSEGGLFIEPMVTYERGKALVNLPTPFNSSRSTVNGLGVGLRLGLHVYESVFIGIDGRYLRPTYKNADTRIDRYAHAHNYGPIIGFQMPTHYGVRVWGSYIMGGEMDVQQDNGIDFTFKRGRGYRVGGGVKLTLVSLNLEYQDIKYDKTQLNDAGIFTGATHSIDQTNKSIIASVSFPFAL